MKHMTLIVAFSAVALAGFSVFADPPDNDLKANAAVIGGETGSLSGTNVDAGYEESGDWLYDREESKHTVWYQWTAPRSGRVFFDTAGSQFDTWLAIGQSGGMLSSNDDDDYGGDRTSLVSARVEANEIYLIEVAGNYDANGSFKLNWRMASENNLKANAVAISGESGTLTDSNVDAGHEEDDWLWNWEDTKSRRTVWYVWTAPKTGIVAFDTIGANFDTALAIGTSDEMFASNDDIDAVNDTSRVKVYVDAGTVYFIEVGGSENRAGLFKLNWSMADQNLGPGYVDEYGNVVGGENVNTVFTGAFGVHVPTSEAVPAASAACQYDGCLADSSGNLVGTVMLKIGKANANTLESKVSGNVVLNGKKTRVSGTFRCNMLNVKGFALLLDANGMSGTWGDYSVDGVRNVFTARDSASKAAASAALSKWKNAYTVAWKGGGPWGGLTVTVANKGKVKVSGMMPNGTKVSVSGMQLLVGGDVANAPILSTKKNAQLAFSLLLKGSETTALFGLTSDKVAGKVAPLNDGAVFRCSYLAADVPIVVDGKKWEAQSDEDVALKLKYNQKTGVFKGSFKDDGRKVTVNGVVVNGQGYGSASVKKVGVEATIK